MARLCKAAPFLLFATEQDRFGSLETVREKTAPASFPRQALFFSYLSFSVYFRPDTPPAPAF